ncbi:MAG: OB-fold domain-containing protein [Candidatus Thorarchaeota archaeon]|nr:OB-fold domain-containing protein [Candidatus Thorarchaeota archaeon]
MRIRIHPQRRVIEVNIEASVCNECNRTVIPPRDICPYCGPGLSPMTLKLLSNEGTILSYTSLHSPPEGFEPPVLLALVELAEGGSVLCLGRNEEMDEVAIGKTIVLSKDSEERFIFNLQ